MTGRALIPSPPAKRGEDRSEAEDRAADLPAAILAALRKRNGGSAIVDGSPARWRPSQSLA
jgi:hypothetical protein